MQPDVTKQLLAQLDSLLSLFQEVTSRSKSDDLSDLGFSDVQLLIAKSLSAIERISGQGSTYSSHAKDIMATPLYDAGKALQLNGLIRSLQSDVEAGYIQRFAELIHGELFADFLEMAAHLLGEGYKDGAAVIAGSALEAHLRQLCIKYGIATEVTKGPDLQPKSAGRMNADLAKAAVCSMLDQKNITAWLDLRNNAAHGKYDQYTKEQVLLLITGIRDFLTRNTA